MYIKLQRIMALIIDYLLIYNVIYIPYFIITSLIKSNLLEILLDIISLIIVLFLFIKKDCIFGYESIGKKIMGLRIYYENEKVKDKKILTDRIIKSICIFPFYPFMILKDNRSQGDIKLNTKIISENKHILLTNIIMILVLILMYLPVIKNENPYNIIINESGLDINSCKIISTKKTEYGYLGGKTYIITHDCSENKEIFKSTSWSSLPIENEKNIEIPSIETGYYYYKEEKNKYILMLYDSKKDILYSYIKTTIF